LRKFAPKNIKTATPICASVFGKVQCFFKRVDKKNKKKERIGSDWLAAYQLPKAMALCLALGAWRLAATRGGGGEKEWEGGVFLQGPAVLLK
jgi:hypothetical protein